ncbi:hypothetical protein J8L84_11920 [Alteromonas sp. MMG017]|uniref:cobalamin biosynthesis protein n=1 Tax=Alteromonas sp. MMG017 TaxID=2822692 RepID=UPI001B39E354|nr:hypothetical protein [Alteromonas sp. MMG017]MBQ4829985.1 hypothetical protein [Alteromonas sp. MMG017]
MNMNPAIEKLNEYLAELNAVEEFASLEVKAEHIGLINQIKSSIGQLELCEKFGINAGSLVSVLPETESPNFCYLTVHENESSNPENWEEVIFEGQQIQFSGGDLVIRK